METTAKIISPAIFNDTQKQQIESLLFGLNEHQIIWLAGYLTGVSQSGTFITQPNSNSSAKKSSDKEFTVIRNEITVLYGSRTGNGEYIAKKLKKQAENNGFVIHLHDTDSYPLKNLSNEKNLIVIISTHGEGVPPLAAEDFFEFIHSKKAKPFENTNFSVLALGDKSYIHFCKTGKDVDKRLEELGGNRIFNRVDCDVDFHSTANEWINGVLSAFSKKLNKGELKINGSKKDLNQTSQIEKEYNRQNPFQAAILDKIKLNGRGSNKEVYHYELSLEKSGLTYEPGDAAGIFPTNSQQLVEELSTILELNQDDKINISGIDTPLKEALTHHFEISGLSRDVIEAYNSFAQSPKLQKILGNNTDLEKFIYNNDLVDLATSFPVKIPLQELTRILRKLQPRLYSISSSLKAHEEELHLTVSSLRYNNSRYKEGVCSTFLSDRLNEGDEVPIYTVRNNDFRLPKDSNAPIIMIGPGTGIAPFRAFLEEREAMGAKGKNWLFFGEQHFATDFLYQTELLQWHKKGLLNRLNVAFSRDTAQKIYVQHKMLEHAKELIDWLDNGAHFYLCGNAKSMAVDVNNTLVDIIKKVKNYKKDKADEYLSTLKKAKRFQTDVY